MYKWRRGSPMMPRVSNDPTGPGQDRRRIHGAGTQLVTQFVAIVGQIADLEGEGDEEEWHQDDPGAHQTNEEVEFQVGLFALWPG